MLIHEQDAIWNRAKCFSACLTPPSSSHRLGITRIFIDPSSANEYLFSSSRDGSIKQTSEDKVVLDYDEHDAWVNDFLVVPLNLPNMNKLLISCSNDSTIKLWNASNTSSGISSKEVCGVNSVPSIVTVEAHSDYVKVLASATSLSPREFISGGLDGLLKLWDIETMVSTMTWSSPQNRGIYACTLNPKRYLVISGYGSGTSNSCPIHLRDMRFSQKVASLFGHQDTVRSIKVHDDGDYILTASSDCTIRLWDLRKTQSSVEVFSHHQALPVHTLAVAFDWSFFISADSQGNIYRRDLTMFAGLLKRMFNKSYDAIQLSKESNGITALELDESNKKLWVGTARASDLICYDIEAKDLKKVSKIKGTPAVVQTQILNGCQEILALDNNALNPMVSRYSLVNGSLQESFPSYGEALEEIASRMNEKKPMKYSPEWCQVKICRGHLEIQLEPNTCNRGYASSPTNQVLNLGQQFLSQFFQVKKNISTSSKGDPLSELKPYMSTHEALNMQVDALESAESDFPNYSIGRILVKDADGVIDTRSICRIRFGQVELKQNWSGLPRWLLDSILSGEKLLKQQMQSINFRLIMESDISDDLQSHPMLKKHLLALESTNVQDILSEFNSNKLVKHPAKVLKYQNQVLESSVTLGSLRYLHTSSKSTNASNQHHLKKEVIELYVQK